MKSLLFLSGVVLLLSACHPADGKAAQTQAHYQTQTVNSPSGQTDSASGLSWMNVSQLPREGQQVYALIGSGGPFRYSKDGVPFGNREGLLPRQPRNYYREYTVPTPGAGNRGTRRIICGGQPTTSRADCYYTADHYVSFRRIRP
ncbi:ribonuclease domain-containing protein [Deinococcus sp.]|uniref:ribonuclease domain-containing protein n=1 Tax=Deinococcus sp. TaxID=47478 RepID=UPI0025BAB4E6|nr:ribonuclease domain-containing protein [Deinococcus sp.]